MPHERGKGFGAGGLRLPPGYFMQYVAAPRRGTGKWILRGPDGTVVDEYALGAPTKGAVEEAAAEHRRANR